MLLECWLRRRGGAAARCCRAAPAGMRNLLSLPLQRALQEHQFAMAGQKIYAVCLALHHALRTCQRLLGGNTCLSSRACVCGCSVRSAASCRLLLLYASSSNTSSSRDGRYNAAITSCRLGRACRACIWGHGSCRLRAPACIAAGPLLWIRIVWALPQWPACAQRIDDCLTLLDAASAQGRAFSCTCQSELCSHFNWLAVMS